MEDELYWSGKGIKISRGAVDVRGSSYSTRQISAVHHDKKSQGADGKFKAVVAGIAAVAAGGYGLKIASDPAYPMETLGGLFMFGAIVCILLAVQNWRKSPHTLHEIRFDMPDGPKLLLKTKDDDEAMACAGALRKATTAG